jgi:hypothetical protein
VIELSRSSWLSEIHIQEPNILTKRQIFALALFSIYYLTVFSKSVSGKRPSLEAPAENGGVNSARAHLTDSHGTNARSRAAQADSGARRAKRAARRGYGVRRDDSHKLQEGAQRLLPRSLRTPYPRRLRRQDSPTHPLPAPLVLRPRKRRSRHCGRTADPTLKSFFFTLKNPHNFPARKFALKAEKKGQAIYCDPVQVFVPFVPVMTVSKLVVAIVTRTTPAGDTLFTGSPAKEIEVFEIAN